MQRFNSQYNSSSGDPVSYLRSHRSPLRPSGRTSRVSTTPVRTTTVSDVPTITSSSFHLPELYKSPSQTPRDYLTRNLSPLLFNSYLTFKTWSHSLTYHLLNDSVSSGPLHIPNLPLRCQEDPVTIETQLPKVKSSPDLSSVYVFTPDSSLLTLISTHRPPVTV